MYDLYSDLHGLLLKQDFKITDFSYDFVFYIYIYIYIYTKIHPHISTLAFNMMLYIYI